MANQIKKTCSECGFEVEYWHNIDFELDKLPFSINEVPENKQHNKSVVPFALGMIWQNAISQYPQISCPRCPATYELEHKDNITPDIVVLEHKFINIGLIDQILEGCKCLGDFIDILIQKAKLNTGFDYNDFVGWGFELFCEALIKIKGYDRRIAITNYKLVQSGDYGVDGFGIHTINNRPVTVQCKFRKNPVYILTANEDHLTNFLSDSQNRYHVRYSDKDNMLIMHTGKNIHHSTMVNMLHGKARELNRKTLSKLSNSPHFWDSFRASVAYSKSLNVAKEVKILRPHQTEAVTAVMNLIGIKA